MNPNESPQRRTIRVKAITRVEGEGGLDIVLDGERLESVRLNIFEPPRLFEAFLRSRPLEEVPDITARICGICPVAYQMSSVHALEKALGISVSEEIRLLRRLLYLAEWIESHALHVYVLHLPDFLGYQGALELAKDQPQLVTQGLQIRKCGNALLDFLAGRAIHPINACVGGFYRAPRSEELTALLPQLETGLQLAMAVTRVLAQLEYPTLQIPYDTVSLYHPDEYPLCEGNLRTGQGETIDVNTFEQHFSEQHVAHSTALQAVRLKTGKPYLLGPLARVNHCFEQLCVDAKRLAEEIGFTVPCTNPYRSILARSLEIVHSLVEAIEIIQSYRPPVPSRKPYQYRQAEGCAATEAPRGLLYHRYTCDEQGKITAARIVPPTSQNQTQIESDLSLLIPTLLKLPDQEIATQCEQLVRCYDPCISCSTHFLDVRIHRPSAEPSSNRSSND